MAGEEKFTNSFIPGVGASVANRKDNQEARRNRNDRRARTERNDNR